MKHVWLINHYAQEPGAPGGTRHYGLARHLPKLGWRATVIAASTELNTGRQRLAQGETKRLADVDGVPFLWVKAPTYNGNGPGRMRNMLAFSFRILLPSTTRELDRPDVIVGSSVHPFAAWSGAVLAKRFGVPFIFEVRDLWPQTLVDMGRLRPDALMTRLLRRLELWLYRRAQKIIVLLPRASEYIEALGIDSKKIEWIPNGVDLETFPVVPYPADSNSFTLMYFGAHGDANGLDSVLRAMAILKQDPVDCPVMLRLIGDGPQKPELQRLAQQLGLTDVVFEPPVPKQRIPELAAEADAFVFNLIDAPVFRFGISSNKLFDFLAGSRPILFCSDASNNPVDDAGAGMTVPPGDPAALAAAMRELVELSADERAAMGRRGREYVEGHHGFDTLSARLAGTLDDVLAIP